MCGTGCCPAPLTGTSTLPSGETPLAIAAFLAHHLGRLCSAAEPLTRVGARRGKSSVAQGRGTRFGLRPGNNLVRTMMGPSGRLTLTGYSGSIEGGVGAPGLHDQLHGPCPSQDGMTGRPCWTRWADWRTWPESRYVRSAPGFSSRTPVGCCGPCDFLLKCGSALSPKQSGWWPPTLTGCPDVSADRVRDEFLRIMSLNGAKGQLEAMDRLGLPEVDHPRVGGHQGSGPTPDALLGRLGTHPPRRGNRRIGDPRAIRIRPSISACLGARKARLISTRP